MEIKRKLYESPCVSSEMEIEAAAVMCTSSKSTEDYIYDEETEL